LNAYDAQLRLVQLAGIQTLVVNTAHDSIAAKARGVVIRDAVT
jgi:hypothetical protein